MKDPDVVIYDPPMCCETGVCGETLNPELPQLVADLAHLIRQGITVHRYNLGTDPEAFIRHPHVRHLLHQQGETVLPMVFVHGELKQHGQYPSRQQLEHWLGSISMTELQELL